MVVVAGVSQTAAAAAAADLLGFSQHHRRLQGPMVQDRGGVWRKIPDDVRGQRSELVGDHRKW